jgi:hypothetical protein
VRDITDGMLVGLGVDLLRLLEEAVRLERCMELERATFAKFKEKRDKDEVKLREENKELRSRLKQLGCDNKEMCGFVDVLTHRVNALEGAILNFTALLSESVYSSKRPRILEVLDAPMVLNAIHSLKNIADDALAQDVIHTKAST